MGLKETTNQLKRLASEIGKDLDKAAKGNKAAAQRVRVKTIELSKIGKVFRKESIAAEKKAGTKAKASTKKTPAKKSSAKAKKKK